VGLDGCRLFCPSPSMVWSSSGVSPSSLNEVMSVPFSSRGARKAGRLDPLWRAAW
jgi:hypothetical protein